jgi:O-antigen ligase
LTRLAVVQLTLYFVFFAAALAFINNEKRLRKTVLTAIIFGALGAFFGLLQRLAGVNGIYGARQTDQAITFASYVNQHHFAALMEMTAGLTLALLFGNATKKDKRIFLIAAAVVMGMALIFTGSRGGLISFVAVLGFIIAANVLNKQNAGKSADDEDDKGGGRSSKNFRRSFALVIGGLGLILGLFGAVLVLGGDQSLLRGVGLEASQNGDVSSGRLYFWSVALKIIRDNPLLGGGLDAFGIAFTRYDTTNGTMRVEQAHNDYLQILADAGIVGFALVASFIFLLFKKGLRVVAQSSDSFRRNVAVGALAGCFGILIHSFFDFPLRTPANAYFFLILAALATATINHPRLYKKQRRRKTEDGNQ